MESRGGIVASESDTIATSSFKLTIISYLVGGRDAERAVAFIQDLADRVANRS
jgi:hypothetical protein